MGRLNLVSFLLSFLAVPEPATFLAWGPYGCGLQNGSFEGTNSTGTSDTKVLSQRAHSSMPACSEGMWPRMMSDFCLPSVTASATYSTVSHSRVSPITR